VLWEKTEMVPPSIFPSKTNGLPCYPTRVGVILRHLSPNTTSALTCSLTYVCELCNFEPPVVLLISYFAPCGFIKYYKRYLGFQLYTPCGFINFMMYPM
jgi:hypothetical protein